MSKAIGGYVRRSERRHVPPATDDGVPRCGYCRARLDLGMYPHVCKELTFGTPQLPPGWPDPLGAMNRFGAAMDRLYADPGVPAAEASALGQMMHSLLGAPEQPGPPYVHTFVPPEPEYDDEGNEIWRPQDPAYTLTQRPVADVVAEAGFGPVPQRIEITADFCQCPACREARCET